MIACKENGEMSLVQNKHSRVNAWNNESSRVNTLNNESSSNNTWNSTAGYVQQPLLSGKIKNI